MKLTSLFPTLIYSDSLPKQKAQRWNAQLKKEAYLFREQDTQGKKWSQKNYAAGYTSYSSITDLTFRSSTFGELKNWIDGHVKAFAKSLKLNLLDGRLEMSTCWLNIMGKHCHHSIHLHPLSVISGTYYVQVPPGAGSLVIEDPRLDAFMGAPPRPGYHVPFAPKVGSLILFEGWTRHEVPANLSSQDRISVSFNYEWIRGPA